MDDCIQFFDFQIDALQESTELPVGFLTLLCELRHDFGVYLQSHLIILSCVEREAQSRRGNSMLWSDMLALYVAHFIRNLR